MIVEVSWITASQGDVELTFELPNLDKDELVDPEWVDPQRMCNDMDTYVNGAYGPFGIAFVGHGRLR